MTFPAMFGWLLYASVCVALGVTVAWAFHRWQEGYLWTAFISTMVGTSVGVAAFGVVGAFEAWDNHGCTISQAIDTGLTMAIIYGWAAPSFGGVPTLAVSMTTLYMLRRTATLYDQW